ncbi:MAG: hypothetical protein H7839_19700 [Magnetococcus sp. YQC-5]
MIKPIHKISCSPALAACQRLMQTFTLWLCDVGVNGTSVTQTNLQGKMPSVIEADWLWGLLQREQGGKLLLDRAKILANLSPKKKQDLADWIQGVAKVADHFGPTPPAALPTTAPLGKDSWMAFKTLMSAFYDKGLCGTGLPYTDSGVPTNTKDDWLTYKKFVDEFRKRHRIDLDPYAREICVLCGGELTQTHVDHWIYKAAFPLLAVCADNLLPICSECNSTSNKGINKVHTKGSFADWFHPYLRHANGAIVLRYDPVKFEISVTITNSSDSNRVRNLDTLLNLSTRWTKEFKAEYRKKQKQLADRQIRGLNPHNAAGLQQWLQDYRDDLSNSEPHYEVHCVLAEALLDPARMLALLG